MHFYLTTNKLLFQILGERNGKLNEEDDAEED